MSLTATSLPPPPDYKCSKCAVHGVKMWRQPNTYADEVHLLCASCALVAEGKQGPLPDASGRSVMCQFKDAETGKDEVYKTDQIGWLVPAVPSITNNSGHIYSYWGYTSVPQEECMWWAALPLTMTDTTKPP